MSDTAISNTEEEIKLDGSEKFQSSVEVRRQEFEDTFSYLGYQVVRKELFAHLRDPAVTIRPDSITFNNACIMGLEDVVYVSIMINDNLKRILVEPCDENDKDALRWCIKKPEKRISRKMTCRDFADGLYDLMEWDRTKRYKVLGYKIEFEGKKMYVFDLTVHEIFDAKSNRRGKKAKSAAENIIYVEKAANGTNTSNGQENGDNNGISGFNDKENTEIEGIKGDEGVEGVSNKDKNGNTTSSRKGYYPDEIKKSFGVSVEEHKKESEVSEINGYISVGMISGKPTSVEANGNINENKRSNKSNNKNAKKQDIGTDKQNIELKKSGH